MIGAPEVPDGRPASPVAPANADSRARSVAAFLLLGSAVFVASLLGVLTRTEGGLAAFWPSNAVLLGLVVRFPRLAQPGGWVCAFAGFLAAGALLGDAPRENLMLTLCNMAGALAGYACYRRLADVDRRLEGPNSAFLMLGVAAVAAAVAGFAGAYVEPLLFSGRRVGGWLSWFTAEAVNYIALLPAVLTIPRQWPHYWRRRWRNDRFALLRFITPVLVLVASFWLGIVVGGPGAIGFPVLALMWCALTYGLFATALLSLVFSIWTLLVIAQGVMHVGLQTHSPELLMSLRIGVTLVAVSPIVLASVTHARHRLVSELRFLAAHDPMTGAMNRRAFRERAEAVLDALRAQRAAASLLVLDIDHFKATNDNYGHMVGDRVITRVVQCIREVLADPEALLGRLGGEEFAVLLPRRGVDEAIVVAERIRAGCAGCVLRLDDGQEVGMTVSVGISTAPVVVDDLDLLIQSADEALYAAKRAGRNRSEARLLPD